MGATPNDLCKGHSRERIAHRENQIQPCSTDETSNVVPVQPTRRAIARNRGCRAPFATLFRVQTKSTAAAPMPKRKEYGVKGGERRQRKNSATE